jgi:hypothetical protein
MNTLPDNTLPDDIPFERWVQHVFDHPLPEQGRKQWHFGLDAEQWDPLADPALTVEYLTMLFTNIDTLIVPYTDGQIDQGIYYLINSSCSNHVFALVQKSVSLDLRIDCVHAFYDVYDKLYAKRCTPALGHLSEAGNPLNHTCYMW